MDMDFEQMDQLVKTAMQMKESDEEHVKFERSLLDQIEKLKKENRNLVQEKIKLESEFWSQDAQQPANDQSAELASLKAQIDAIAQELVNAQSQIDNKTEIIDNLVIERNEVTDFLSCLTIKLREIKDSLNSQVYSKSSSLEMVKEKLRQLSESMTIDLEKCEAGVHVQKSSAPEAEALSSEAEDGYKSRITGKPQWMRFNPKRTGIRGTRTESLRHQDGITRGQQSSTSISSFL